MLPKDALHVTDLSEAEPVTVAVNGIVPLVREEADEGEIVTPVTPGLGGVGLGGVGFGVEVTTTVADADLLGSLTLVAVTAPVAAFDGALKSPLGVMLPMDAVHVTDSLLVVPWTVAANCILPFVATDAEDGETVTEVVDAPFADAGFP